MNVNGYKFGCTGKMFYVSEGEARAYIKRLKLRQSSHGQNRVYKCKYENHWHITSMQKKAVKKLIKKKFKVFFKHV